MVDAIIDSILYKYLYLQIIPAFIGLLFINKMEASYKYFVLLLWYGVFNEIIALYYGRFISDGVNKIFYNIFNIIYFTFLFSLFYKKGESLVFKKVIIVISILYLVSIAYEVLIEQMDYHNQTQVIPYIIGCIGVLIGVFYYLICILISNKQENIYRDLFLWIAIAYFFYYLGFTPIKIGENYFATFKEYHLFDLKITITFLKSFILSIGFIIWSRQKI